MLEERAHADKERIDRTSCGAEAVHDSDRVEMFC